MAEAPFFSVVVPTFNRSGLLLRTLQTVLDQTHRDFEVIVIDDGGTDDTEAVVSAIAHPAVRYHKKVHGERGAARNAGARLARGRYVNFLDSDDAVYPHHLQAARAFIVAHDEPEVCHFDYEVRESPQGRVVRTPDLRGDLNERLIEGNLLCFNAAFLRRDIALDHPFSEDPELGGEDWHLWLRLGARFPLRHAATVTAIVISHESRSVVTLSQDTLLRRQSRLLGCLFDDPEVRRRYGRHEGRMKAGVHCYVALHLALGRQSAYEAARCLSRAVAAWPAIVTTRAFHGAVKRLAMSVVSRPA